VVSEDLASARMLRMAAQCGRCIRDSLGVQMRELRLGNF